jgi:hypothetical protein
VAIYRFVTGITWVEGDLWREQIECSESKNG